MVFGTCGNFLWAAWCGELRWAPVGSGDTGQAWGPRLCAPLAPTWHSRPLTPPALGTPRGKVSNGTGPPL